ncbi:MULTISPECIES: hypothetical protein [Nitrosomonas]|uniref:Uncharacterized protein n=1 Tax=Nitrosomonas communis TaxID=44574 RepID=A0A0F7KFC1_9PROT|nr:MULTISPECIES: hypothetical protein [Nitrosomonas]AKH37554.1 hypothetical protein AAW31_06560 [Nitrosomonas communis]TYP78473.1 hypothetical protein BCL69_10725 [Nitrosomonas communis]UVS62815.1 hypothetical protein NX761_06825 [Nitrosomonas sp. PLL12]
MNELTPCHDAQSLKINITDLSVSEIAALPPAQLQELHSNLLTMQANIKTVLDRVHAALNQRYGEQASAMRLQTGKDFGVCHLTDGPVRVTVDLPKRVSWDQVQLSILAERITQAGENVSDYIDIEYSIAEFRYNHWPASLQGLFNSARTVKPGKASYRFALLNSKGEA